MPFPFQISATKGRARTGVLKTSRGDIRTPAFMPVGTAATVKAMTVDQVKALFEAGYVISLGHTDGIKQRTSQWLRHCRQNRQ